MSSLPLRLNANIDLNLPPPEETSPRERLSMSVPILRSFDITTIDLPMIPSFNVAPIANRVTQSSPRTFGQAKNNVSTIANIGMTTMSTFGNVNSANQTRIYEPNYTLSLQTIENFLALGGGIIRPAVTEPQPEPKPEPKAQPPPPPPKEPTPEPPKPLVYDCPICLSPLKEEMATRCGHIFCKWCIRTAITMQGKCPTCRKKITARTLIRVFLPSPAQ